MGGANPGLATLVTMIAVYVLVAIVTTSVVWWCWRWKAAGLTFAVFVALAGSFWWFGMADYRAWVREGEQAQQIADPLWRAAGVTPVPYTDRQRFQCLGGEVVTFSVGAPVADPDLAVADIDSRLRSDGWTVAAYVDPDHARRWVYAIRGDTTVAAAPDVSEPSGADRLVIDVILHDDCGRLTEPSGATVEPRCAHAEAVGCSS